MPSVAHFVFGLSFGLFLYFMSEKRFTKSHVFILFLNNVLGPDLGWALGIGDYTHTYIGFAVFALVLAWFNFYFTRFTPDVRNMKLIDKGQASVDYGSAYCLVLAGGIMHLYLDGIINNTGRFYIFPALLGDSPTILNIGWFQELWKYPRLAVGPSGMVFVGIAFYCAFFYFAVYSLTTEEKKHFLILISIVVGFMFAFYLFGNAITSFHADAGAIVYISLYFFLPWGLILVSVSKPQRIRINPSFPWEKHEMTVRKILKTFSILFAIIGVGIALAANWLVNEIIRRFPVWAPTMTALRIFFIGMGILLIISGIYSFYLDQRVQTGVPHLKLIIYYKWLLLTAVIGIIVFLAVIFLRGTAVPVIVEEFPEIYDMIAEDHLDRILLPAGLLLLPFIGLNLYMIEGLRRNDKKIYEFVIRYQIVLAITIVGLIFACFLSENDIQEIFQKNS